MNYFLIILWNLYKENGFLEYSTNKTDCHDKTETDTSIVESGVKHNDTCTLSAIFENVDFLVEAVFPRNTCTHRCEQKPWGFFFQNTLIIFN